jgi:hypothetical protein
VSPRIVNYNCQKLKNDVEIKFLGSCLALTYNVWQACTVRFMKHCLPKRFYKDMCLLDFCKMKMSIREATLNLQKPCTSARIAPWLAVMGCLYCPNNFVQIDFFE